MNESAERVVRHHSDQPQQNEQNRDGPEHVVSPRVLGSTPSPSDPDVGSSAKSKGSYRAKRGTLVFQSFHIDPDPLIGGFTGKAGAIVCSGYKEGCRVIGFAGGGYCARSGVPRRAVRFFSSDASSSTRSETWIGLEK